MSTTAPTPVAHEQIYGQDSAVRQPTHRRARGPRQRYDGARQRATANLVDSAEPTQSRPSALAMRPASVAPSRTATPRARNPANNSRSAAEKGARQGPAPGRLHEERTVGRRQFGGRLTTNNDHTLPSSFQLDAPEFVPGARASKTSHRPPDKPADTRSESKSTAPDIATRIHQDIDHGQYECPICTNEILRNSRIWSCHKCWTVFHLGCIKQWSSNHDAILAANENLGSQAQTVRQWRCPGCNLAQDVKPSSYTCWCGKEHGPRSIPGLPPHSCGDTCGKSRSVPKCPHPCELQCHAGPCPPCTRDGPIQSCFCGKKSSTRKCLDTDYDSGWSCRQTCGDVMPCGEHTCDRECHQGLCGACEVRMDTRCYCGQENKSILCADRDDDISCTSTETTSDGEAVTEHWTGQFTCTNACQQYFDCGKHQCLKPCHPSDGPRTRCPRSPDLVRHCPCGKTELKQLSQNVRQSCEDAIPSCTRPCLKTLACEHQCQQICHSGECRPCLKNVTVNCRCGKTASSTVCHQGNVEPPQCTRTCRTTLHCGRHECGERCCPGEKKATDRQASKRKLRPLGSAPLPSINDTYEPEHICTRTCGRKLKCGNHTCEELCHKGPCGSCREAIFDEISCHCGRTVLQPPLPCGTKNPPCRYDCERSKLCGHPQVPHNCHPDDDSCPRCPYFTTKPCLCGRKTLQNQQCWFAEVRCGEVCGRKLKCGAHACRKTCHKPGECDDAASKCQQACGKPRSSCAHPCEDTCHAPYPCKEEKQCTHKILITCECQHHKQETRCSASKSSEGNATKSLKCDDECARLERNRRLAAALDIDPSTHTDDHVPYSTETLTIYASHTKWATEQEREIRVFVADSLQKRIRFKPMHKSQRDFLHNLAEDFGLDHESIDPEPHRHVAVFKTPRFVAAPTKTLRDCARIRGRQQVVADKEAAETARAKAEAARPDPWNGFVLGEPRFALTSEEVDEVVRPVLGSSSSSSAKLGVEVTFIQTGEVVLLARSLDTNASSLESQLKSLKPPLFRALTSQTNICKSMHLCAFNPITQRTTRRETDGVANGINGASNGSSGAGGGWSQVAARGAAARTLPPQMGLGVKSAFTVLGNGNGSAAVKSAKSARSKEKSGRVADREKERERESVAEDWEEEAAKEFAGGASSMVEQQIEQGEVEKEAEIEAGTKTKAEVEKEKEKEKEVEVEVEVGGDLAESTAGENHVVDTEEGGEVVT